MMYMALLICCAQVIRGDRLSTFIHVMNGIHGSALVLSEEQSYAACVLADLILRPKAAYAIRRQNH